MICRNARGRSTGSAELGNSSKASSLTLSISQAPSPPSPAPGDLSQIKDGKVNKSKPCQTLWLTHQKFPQQCSTLCLPSLPTNLVESEGSPLIHACESALNQPLIKREHTEVSSNIFTALLPLLKSDKTEASRVYLSVQLSAPMFPLKCLKAPWFGPVTHSTSTDIKHKANIHLAPSNFFGLPFCFLFLSLSFCLFFFPPVVVMSVPRVSVNELNISVLVGRAQLLLEGLNAERCLRIEQQWRWQRRLCTARGRGTIREPLWPLTSHRLHA